MENEESLNGHREQRGRETYMVPTGPFVLGISERELVRFDALQSIQEITISKDHPNVATPAEA